MVRPSFPRKLAEDYVLKIIKESQPISLYKLAKKLKYSYGGCVNYIKELIEKGKLRTELKLNENNRAVRLIYIK